MDSSPEPKPVCPCESALAQTSGALQEASLVLGGVSRSMAGGIGLRQLEHGLSRLEAVVARLAGVRDRLWLQRYEAQLENEGFPARPPTDHGTGRGTA